MNGVLKRCFDAFIEAKNTIVRMKFFSQEYLTHFFTQNMQTMWKKFSYNSDKNRHVGMKERSNLNANFVT